MLKIFLFLPFVNENAANGRLKVEFGKKLKFNDDSFMKSRILRYYKRCLILTSVVRGKKIVKKKEKCEILQSNCNLAKNKCFYKPG